MSVICLYTCSASVVCVYVLYMVIYLYEIRIRVQFTVYVFTLWFNSIGITLSFVFFLLYTVTKQHCLPGDIFIRMWVSVCVYYLVCTRLCTMCTLSLHI